MDSRIEKLADVMINYSIKVKKGNLLKIQGPYLAMPLIKAAFAKALEVGAHPYADIINDELAEIFIKQGNDDQLKYIPEMRKLEIENIDTLLHIWGSYNTKYLTNADPSRQALMQKARKDLTQRYFERTASGELRWCGTLFPNYAMAQDAEKSLTEFEDFVYSAGHCDEDDPISFWQNFSREQQKLCDAMNKVNDVQIKGENTDLKLKVEKRKWINCDGTANFPDGEVFTSPVEDSASGVIAFSFPACYGGREVEDVRMTFKSGELVEFSAGKNYDFLKEMLNIDDGAKRIGEFAIGTNYNIQTFSKNTLFDEKIGGTCHLAVGNSIYESGGKNKSAIHWDMVCDLRNGGEILADGELIYKDGKFIAGFGG